MDIPPINNLMRVIEPGHQDERQPSPKRHHQRKREKITAGPTYTPYGHLDKPILPKIDVVA